MTAFICLLGLVIFIICLYQYSKKNDSSPIKDATVQSDLHKVYKNDYTQIQNPFQLFQQLEWNTFCLIKEYNKIYGKQPHAPSHNIHYTLMLPLFKSINQQKNFLFKPRPTTMQEKKLLDSMLKNSTSMFCLSYMLLKSPRLNGMIKQGFTLPSEMKELLEMIAKTVNKSKIAATSIGNPKPNEAIELLEVIAQIQWVHANVSAI